MGYSGSGLHMRPAPMVPPPDADMVAFYTEQLENAIREHKAARRKRMFQVAGIAALVLFAVFSKGHVFGWWWWWGGLFGGGAAVKASLDHKRQALEALMNANDPRPINVLAIAAADNRYDMRDVAVRNLKNVLPLINAGNANLITADGMSALIALLDRRDPELLLGILHMLEQAGDERALSAVERLAKSHVPPGDLAAMLRGEWSSWMHSSNVSWEQVKDAAKECLPYLEAKAEQKRNSETLLRAAGDPGTRSEALLRPASATETSEEQLLRPAT